MLRGKWHQCLYLWSKSVERPHHGLGKGGGVGVLVTEVGAKTGTKKKGKTEDAVQTNMNSLLYRYWSQFTAV